jgi:hypothetical protein
MALLFKSTVTDRLKTVTVDVNGRAISWEISAFMRHHAFDEVTSALDPQRNGCWLQRESEPSMVTLRPAKRLEMTPSTINRQFFAFLFHKSRSRTF